MPIVVISRGKFSEAKNVVKVGIPLGAPKKADRIRFGGSLFFYCWLAALRAHLELTPAACIALAVAAGIDAPIIDFAFKQLFECEL